MNRRSPFTRWISPRASLGSIVVLVLVGTLGFGSVVPASAGGLSVAAGSCTGGADWKLSVRRVGPSLSVAYRITDSPPRHRWTVFLDNDGWGFFSGTRRADRRGTMDLKKDTSNGVGPDRITAAATDRATGETCAGVVVVT